MLVACGGVWHALDMTHGADLVMGFDSPSTSCPAPRPGHRSAAVASMILGLAVAPSAAWAQATVTFDAGTEGWSISGRTTIQPTGGNPGANLRGQLLDVFGADIRNSTDPRFLGDYTRYGGSVTLAIDIKVNSIAFFGNEVTRNLVLELRDRNPPGSSYPWVSAWVVLSPISRELTGNWTTFSATFDPRAVALPPGWGGTGDEDPGTSEPRLPPGRTFASVLASVDEIAFTTFQPGFFYGFTNMDLQVDNVRVIPAPACAGVLLLAGCGVIRRRRR